MPSLAGSESSLVIRAGWSGDESLSFAFPLLQDQPDAMQVGPPAPTRQPYARKPSAPWLRTRSSPRCSNPLMADSIAGCARRAATNDSSSSRSRSALERYPLPGNALTSSSASRRTRLSRL